MRKTVLLFFSGLYVLTVYVHTASDVPFSILPYLKFHFLFTVTFPKTVSYEVPNCCSWLIFVIISQIQGKHKASDLSL